jgi:hypothetical protein
MWIGGMVPQIGAWTEFGSNDWVAESLGKTSPIVPSQTIFNPPRPQTTRAGDGVAKC